MGGHAKGAVPPHKEGRVSSSADLLSDWHAQNGYDLTLAKWLMVSMVQKNNIRALYTTEDIQDAQKLNKLIIDSLVAVRRRS
jgi:hypothetical protein